VAHHHEEVTRLRLDCVPGAGWGGCCAALVQPSENDEELKLLKQSA